MFSLQDSCFVVHLEWDSHSLDEGISMLNSYKVGDFIAQCSECTDLLQAHRTAGMGLAREQCQR